MTLICNLECEVPPLIPPFSFFVLRVTVQHIFLSTMASAIPLLQLHSTSAALHDSSRSSSLEEEPNPFAIVAAPRRSSRELFEVEAVLAAAWDGPRMESLYFKLRWKGYVTLTWESSQRVGHLLIVRQCVASAEFEQWKAAAVEARAKQREIDDQERRQLRYREEQDRARKYRHGASIPPLSPRRWKSLHRFRIDGGNESDDEKPLSSILVPIFSDEIQPPLTANANTIDNLDDLAVADLQHHVKWANGYIDQLERELRVERGRRCNCQCE
jgi:hypothetical protein